MNLRIVSPLGNMLDGEAETVALLGPHLPDVKAILLEFQQNLENANQDPKRVTELFNGFRQTMAQFNKDRGISSEGGFMGKVIEEFQIWVFRKQITDLISRHGLDHFNFILGKLDKSLVSTALTKEVRFVPITKNIDFGLGIEEQFLQVRKTDGEYKVTETKDGKYKIHNSEEITYYLPLIGCECKTYLDKTMYAGSKDTHEQLRILRNRSYYYIVMLAKSIKIKEVDVGTMFNKLFVLADKKNGEVFEGRMKVLIETVHKEIDLCFDVLSGALNDARGIQGLIKGE